MAASQVEIVNIAMQLCGEVRINSMAEETKAAREANSAWGPARRALLRQYRWNFARARAQLAPLVAAPLMGFQFQFAVPSNFLSLTGIYQDGLWQQQYTDITIPYVTENTDNQRVILADVNPLFITYTRDVTDTAQFDALFDMLLGHQLAVMLQYPLSLSIQRTEQIKKDLVVWEKKAKFSNAIESKPEIITASEWVDSRFAGDNWLRRGPVA